MFLLPADYWEIKMTRSKGRGVFAAKDIPAGTIIGDYIGKVIKTAEEETFVKDNSLYLMYYHDYASLLPLDKNAPGIHLINHACTPNAWVYTYQGHTLFFALRRIYAGEEITISYLLSPDDCQTCTHTCACESVYCTGTMHLPENFYKEWDAVRSKLAAKTKRKRIRFGKVLPQLDAYPKHIPDHPFYSLYGTTHLPPFVLDHAGLLTIPQIRRLIRKTGRTLSLPKRNIIVVGVQQNSIILQEQVLTSPTPVNDPSAGL